MLYFLVNPKSGNGKGQQVWFKARDYLQKQGVPYEEAFLTDRAGQGVEWCAALAERLENSKQSPVLVVVGGDGTLNEAVNGILHSSVARTDRVSLPLSLAFLPAGSGNDFARGHGLPLDPVAALKQTLIACREARRKSIDVLEVNGRYAISSIGAGLDGQVAYTANRAAYKPLMNRVRLGFAAYIWSLLRVLGSYHPAEAELTVDGHPVKLSKLWLAAVSNSPYYGGGMNINPAAVPDDGLAEICVVSGISRFGLLRAFPLVYSGRHTDHPHVTFFRGRHIQLTAITPLRIQTDGEDGGLTPARIRILPNAISLCL